MTGPWPFSLGATVWIEIGCGTAAGIVGGAMLGYAYFGPDFQHGPMWLPAFVAFVLSLLGIVLGAWQHGWRRTAFGFRLLIVGACALSVMTMLGSASIGFLFIPACGLAWIAVVAGDRARRWPGASPTWP